MSDQMELTLDEAPALGTPVTDEGEAALMQAEYGIVLNKILNLCHEVSVPVAIAACVSAGFCISAGYASTAEEARNYLALCFRDADQKLEEAIAQRMAANGGNTEPVPGMVGGEN